MSSQTQGTLEVGLTKKPKVLGHTCLLSNACVLPTSFTVHWGKERGDDMVGQGEQFYLQPRNILHPRSFEHWMMCCSHITVVGKCMYKFTLCYSHQESRSSNVYFHKRNQLCIGTIAWRLNFVVKCSIHFHEIWCWVKWWTFSICMWRTLGIFATQQPLMFPLMFSYWLQDFEGGEKWKLSQAKKDALRVNSSKVDFEHGRSGIKR